MCERVLAILSLTIFAAIASLIIDAEEKPMMKAVVAHEYGAPDVLKFEDVPRPEPSADEARVRVIASGVNPADPLTLSGAIAAEQQAATHHTRGKVVLRVADDPKS